MVAFGVFGLSTQLDFLLLWLWQDASIDYENLMVDLITNLTEAKLSSYVKTWIWFEFFCMLFGLAVLHWQVTCFDHRFCIDRLKPQNKQHVLNPICYTPPDCEIFWVRPRLQSIGVFHVSVQSRDVWLCFKTD